MVDLGGIGVDGLDAVSGCGAQELMQEERVASGGAMAGLNEAGLRDPPKLLARQLGGGLGGERVQDELVEAVARHRRAQPGRPDGGTSRAHGGEHQQR